MAVLGVLGVVLLLAAAGVFVAGLVLIWQGWRGIPDFSEPFCRKCGYDLRGLNWTAPTRTCPECGSDLTAAKAIHFGKYQRRPRRMIVGVTLLTLGLFLPFGARLAYVLVQNRGRLTETNQTLIANVTANANDPFSWQKLCDRYNTGQLKPAEAAAAIEAIITHLKATPSQRGLPLPWSGDLVKLALAAGDIPDEGLTRLCDAFYGSEPTLLARPRLRAGKKFELRTDHTGGWDLPGTRSLLALREVTVDGRPVELTPQYTTGQSKHYLSCGRHQQIGAELAVQLAPGQHEVEFHFDRGLVDEKAKVDPRYEGRPGQADRWPPTLLKQAITVKLKLEVLEPGVAAVALVTDPQLDPTASITLSGIEVIAQPGSKQVTLKPLIEIKQPPVPAAFRIFAEIDGHRVDIGQYGAYANGVSSSLGRTCDAPPAGLKAVRIILEPDPEFAEDMTAVDRIWGKPIVIENVKLERYDAEEDAPPATRPAGR